MIVPDVNVLIYAINRDDPLHQKASAWLNEALVGDESVGFVWNVLIGFLRITTRANFPSALTVEQALAAIAIEHQAEVCSNDADFARFPGLRWRNPLAS